MVFFSGASTRFHAMACPYGDSQSHSLDTLKVGRTPLEKLSAQRRDLYLTTHNTHNIEISMPLAGFEPAINRRREAASPLDHAATGIVMTRYFRLDFFKKT